MSSHQQNSIDWPHIVRTHGPSVWRTLFRMVGNREAAHDCYQETFLSAVRAARRQRIDNWSAFLKAIATRRAIDHLRKRYLDDAHLHLADDMDDRVDPIAPVHTELAKLEQKDLCERVRQLLTSLPPRQAQAFWMRHMEQMSISHIAEQMETPPGNVSVLLNRAASHLKEELSKTGNSVAYGEVTA